MYIKIYIYICIYLAAGNTQYNWGALRDIGIVFVVCYIVLQCLGHVSIYASQKHVYTYYIHILN